MLLYEANGIAKSVAPPQQASYIAFTTVLNRELGILRREHRPEVKSAYDKLEKQNQMNEVTADTAVSLLPPQPPTPLLCHPACCPSFCTPPCAKGCCSHDCLSRH